MIGELFRDGPALGARGARRRTFVVFDREFALWKRAIA
jgi:hypothetical protein